jgi:predicted double-glycine peptidase
MLNVPDVFQATPYNCGPSSLTAVLNYFHFDKREAEVAALAKTTEDDGTDPFDLLEAAQKLGLNAKLK